MPIYLTGMRGSGKTTVGRILAENLKAPFVDLDHLLCQDACQDIDAIVRTSGWATFRQLESQTLQKAARQLGSHGVCATGGGIVLAAENRRLMRDSGAVVLLAPPIEVLHQRLLADPLASQRPPLSASPLYEELLEVWSKREALYRGCAHLILEERLAAPLLAGRIQAWINGET